MSERLDAAELLALIESVFRVTAEDRGFALLVDLPDDVAPDNPDWAVRRAMAEDWHAALAAARTPFERVSLVRYRNARRNNADLPAHGTVDGRGEQPLAQVFDEHDILMAPTEFSTTAPLKVAAREHGFRAATMPGFAPSMIPALRLDWEEVHDRCVALKARLDVAGAARLRLEVDGGIDELILDLRHRVSTASGGLVRERGCAGNLPSGETYIVPYEGERDGDPSGSAGILPLQLDGELLRYRIEGNRIVEVIGDGPVARAERREVEAEPAYRNVAELGLGVLGAYGIRPVGEVLLDEKLGLHVAFGRSDHFGGIVGPADFSAPDRVVHIDRVYLRELQPFIRVAEVDLLQPDGSWGPLMRDGRYV